MFISSNFSWRDLSGLHLAGCFSEQWERESGKRVFLSHASQGRWKKLSALGASKTNQCLVFSFSVPLPVRRLTVNLSSRKIPGLNVYAQMQNEKEQEMKSPANPTEASASSQRDLVHSLEILDTEFNSRPIGEYVRPPHLNPGVRPASSSSVVTPSHVSSPLILCPFFCSSEVKRSWPRRDERELEKSSVITLCSSSVVLLQSEISEWWQPTRSVAASAGLRHTSHLISML